MEFDKGNSSFLLFLSSPLTVWFLWYFLLYLKRLYFLEEVNLPSDRLKHVENSLKEEPLVEKLILVKEAEKLKM